MDSLDSETRTLLARFVCAMAWADFEVQPEERQYILSLLAKLQLDAAAVQEIEAWLERPPEPDLVDPFAIPTQARRLFLEEAEQVIRADGRVLPEERELLSLFRSILYPEARE